LRDYGHADQLGLEATPEEYVEKLVKVFREVRRVLRDDGTLWLNLGDSYAAGGSGGCSPTSTLTGGGGRYRSGSKLESQHAEGFIRKAPPGLKPKDLCGIPWRVAFALQADGWYLRSDIIWHKPNPMPESVTDRPTKAHEYLFLLTKSARYYYDAVAIREPATCKAMPLSSRHDGGKRGEAMRKAGLGSGNSGGTLGWNRPELGRNKRTVWTITTKPYAGAHFAVMPEALVKPCILAGTKPGDVVLDPFMGAGTVAKVAHRLDRNWLGCELSAEYTDQALQRLEPLTSQERLFA
jgi:DNA modification methylase